MPDLLPPPPATPQGLTTPEARRRLAQQGPNSLPPAPRERWWRQLLRQFSSPLIYILLFALVVDALSWGLSGAGGLPVQSLAIAAILALNAALGMWQERKAEHAVAELESLSAPHAWVMRDGTLTRLPTAELVPGDMARVEAGDRVPADGLARDAQQLALDESILTGESLPVEKERGADLFAGTLVVRGRSWAEVTRTGAASAMGRLATLLSRITADPTPLERRLDRLGRRIAVWVVALAAGLTLLGLVAGGIDHLPQVVLFSVALAVAAVPEGLPAILTTTLTLGVQRMGRQRAVVRRLAAVEALGSVTLIATDKTGTITENRLEVRALDASDTADALLAMALANDAEPDSEAGDPMDLALVAYARRSGLDVGRARAERPRAGGRAFDSSTRFMRVTVGAPEPYSYLKGAPEVLLERCRLTADERARVQHRIQRRAREGFRLLGLARGAGDAESDLTWLGLVSLWDPPRPEVTAAIDRARAAGIRVVLVTGDHPETARTIAHTVGLPHRELVTGAELDTLDGPAFAERLRHVTVFARISPEQKLRIVEVFQAAGEIVAMTGDGINDAPALKRADVGVAMGQRGSDVSREVADLVLLDDNFATIVHAVDEGRGIYYNIQKFIRFLFATNLSELVVVTLGGVVALALGRRDAAGDLLLPLTAAQILWINLVTDGAPALALGLDRNPGVMWQAPRRPDAPLLDAPTLRFILVAGFGLAAVTLAILWLTPLAGLSARESGTAAFAVLGTAQLLFAYSARRSDISPRPNPVLHAAVAVGFVLQAAILVLPGLRDAFGLAPLRAAGWAWVAAGLTAAWAWAELARWLVWPSSRRADS